MSDETYYTVLNIKETASASEIKTAYRDLIKQIHPDTVANLAPYLRKIAEDKAKELTEAYTVLSNSSKRREYDRQLAEYRHQNAPQAPPQPTPPPPTHSQQPASQSASSFGYCNRCGTSLHASGFCPKCNKFAVPVASPPQPKVDHWLGYNWAPLMRWAREHPILALAIPLFVAWVIGVAVSGNDTSSHLDSNCPPSQRVEVNGHFVCQQVAVQPSQTPTNSGAASPAAAGFTVVSGESAPSKATVSVSGAYLGTVHNTTVNLSSTFTVVVHQKKGGLLDGCMEVKLPLYGSGVLRGTIRGSHVSFAVADITFDGDVSKTGITGSYVVTRREGNQLGDFRLTKQTEGKGSYSCVDGAVAEFEVTDTPPKPKLAVKSPAVTYAIVRYGATIYNRCAFLPIENYRRCDYGPEEVAELKQGDRVRVLSPLTRAQNGDDIYKVRTQQGWEGWIKSEDIFLEPQ